MLEQLTSVVTLAACNWRKPKPTDLAHENTIIVLKGLSNEDYVSGQQNWNIPVLRRDKRDSIFPTAVGPKDFLRLSRASQWKPCKAYGGTGNSPASMEVCVLPLRAYF